jgi:hypothetical protein
VEGNNTGGGENLTEANTTSRVPSGNTAIRQKNPLLRTLAIAPWVHHASLVGLKLVQLLCGARAGTNSHNGLCRKPLWRVEAATTRHDAERARTSIIEHDNWDGRGPCHFFCHAAQEW